jgi:hypothetical protein
VTISAALVVLSSWLVGLGRAEAGDAYLVRKVWTGDVGSIDDAALVVRDGKIIAVGTRQSVAIPADCQVHDLGDAAIIPGLVIAETALAEGIRGDDRAIAPEVRAIDGFDPFADRRRILEGGVTTVAIVPGVNRLIPGQAAVVKLAGENLESRTLAEAESLRVLSPQSSYPLRTARGGGFRGASAAADQPPVGGDPGRSHRRTAGDF